MSIKKRKGLIIISDELSDSYFNEWFRTSMEVLSRVCIVRCEHLFIEKVFEYYCYSEHFDEIAEGEKVPRYIAILQTLKNPNKDAPPIVTFKEFERVG